MIPAYPYQAADVLDKIADIRQLARVAMCTTATDARRALLFQAGGFDVEVLPDRGMDLGPVTWQGTPISFCTPALWQSPPPTDGGEDFGRRFGAGMLTTCGLDQFGSPNYDAGQLLPQQGRATDLPAANLSPNAVWTDHGHEISIS